MYILFDIGGTKMRIAASSDLTDFSEPTILATPKDFAGGWEQLKQTIQQIASGQPVQAMAGGLPGPINHEDSCLLDAPNLPDWVGQPLAHLLEEEFQTKVFVRNDTALVGLGEATAGAGVASQIMAYITVSTGVGGARIVDKKIDETVVGFEPGHQIILAEQAWSDPAGHAGHLDSLISGRALTERFNKPPYEIIDDEVWRQAAYYLAVGLYNTILHWSPDTVVLGGSMMKVPGIKLSEMEADLKKMMHIFPTLPVLKPADLADLGGLHGALSFLKQNRA